MIYAGQLFGAGGIKAVQRGSVGMPAEPAKTRTVTIASVNPAKAFVLVTVRSGANSISYHSITAELINGTTLRFEVSSSDTSTTVVWQVIEFL